MITEKKNNEIDLGQTGGTVMKMLTITGNMKSNNDIEEAAEFAIDLQDKEDDGGDQETSYK